MKYGGRHQSGIYALVHKPTGKMYIGSSVKCMYNRCSWHLCVLRKGTHPNCYFQELWNNSQENDWEHIVLEGCNSDICREREDYWLKLKHDVIINFSISHSNIGVKRREATRAKMRASAQQRCKDPSYLSKLSARVKKQQQNGNFGQRTWTENTITRQHGTPVRPQGKWK